MRPVIQLYSEVELILKSLMKILSYVLQLKPASRTVYANAIGKHFEIDMAGLMEIVRGKEIKCNAMK